MDTLTITSFLFFTGLVAFLTWRMTRGKSLGEGAAGYFLAGRSLTGGFIAGSLLLTNLSTEQLVGLNGAAFKDGLCVMAWEVLAAVSLVAMALFFLPRYLRSGITTIPEFLEQRFDAGTRMLTTILFVLAYAGILLPIILYTGATGLIDVLNLGALTGIESRTTLLQLVVWGIGIGGSIYAIFGGLRSVAVSDTLNGFGLLVGGVLIAWLGLDLVGGPSGGVVEGWRTLRDAHPERFNSLGAADQSVPFSTLFTGVLLINLFYWTTNQQIIQRTFGARSLAEGQKGVLIAGVLKALAPLILVLPGLMAYHLYADQEVAADQAYGRLVNDVLPEPLLGFFAAVLVGAILSSFNSALNSTATLISMGLVKPASPTIDDLRLIRIGQVLGGVVAVVAMAAAPLLHGQTSIFNYLQTMNALYFIPILAVVLIGLCARRVPAIAAKLGLVLGLAAIAMGYFVFGVGTPAAGLDKYHFLGIVFAALILFMLAIGFLRPGPRWTAPEVGSVDLTPWRWARWVGIGLLALVVGIYVAFADPSVL